MRGRRQLRAVIWVPDRTAEGMRWIRACSEHCQRAGYQVIAIVIGDRWDDAMGMLGTGQADVIVLGRRDQLQPDRLPRVESLDDPQFHHPDS